MIDHLIGLSIICVLIILFMLLKAKKPDKSSQIVKTDQDDDKVNTQPKIMNPKTDTASNRYLKIYKSKVPNTNISLEKKVPTTEFLDYVKREDYRKELSNMGFVYMWDFGVNASKNLNKGDKIWILTGDKLYETELEFIIKDEDGKIGDEIGWARQFGSPWKNVAVFYSCIKHNEIPSWVYNYSRQQKRGIAKNFYKLS